MLQAYLFQVDCENTACAGDDGSRRERMSSRHVELNNCDDQKFREEFEQSGLGLSLENQKTIGIVWSAQENSACFVIAMLAAVIAGTLFIDGTATRYTLYCLR